MKIKFLFDEILNFFRIIIDTNMLICENIVIVVKFIIILLVFDFAELFDFKSVIKFSQFVIYTFSKSIFICFESMMFISIRILAIKLSTM